MRLWADEFCARAATRMSLCRSAKLKLILNKHLKCHYLFGTFTRVGGMVVLWLCGFAQRERVSCAIFVD